MNNEFLVALNGKILIHRSFEMLSECKVKIKKGGLRWQSSIESWIILPNLIRKKLLYLHGRGINDKENDHLQNHFSQESCINHSEGFIQLNTIGCLTWSTIFKTFFPILNTQREIEELEGYSGN